jgi:hypothetical protein
VPRRLVGEIPDRLPTRRRVVALTFDAGADNGGAPKILSALARTGGLAKAVQQYFATDPAARLRSRKPL